MGFPSLEAFEFAQNFKIRFGTKDLNTNVNLFFIYFVFISLVFVVFRALSLAFIKKAFKSRTKYRQSITPVFAIIFNLCSLSFLILYHKYFIAPELTKELGKEFSDQKSLIFFIPCDQVKFKMITFILASFSSLIFLVELNSRDFSNAISNILHSALLLITYYYGYENYAVVLAINHGFYQVFTDLLFLLALHSDKDHISVFRILTIFKFFAWIYIFLNFLPSRYLFPTLHANEFKPLLLFSFVVWYVSKILNSPLLDAIQHQVYHITAADCPGEHSPARCLMLSRNLNEWRHQCTMKKAYLSVKLHHQRHQLNKLNLSETAATSSTAFQTIKTVIMLKRKLKRIRENQRHENQQNN